MNKRLAGMMLTTGLLTISPDTKDTDANTLPKIQNTSKQQEIQKIVKNDVLFTIDDGPSTYMLDIAKTLDSLKYEGIFYVVTRGIKESTKKDLVEVINMGHHIGNHSFSHPNFQKLTINQAKEEILKGDSLIDAVYQEAGISREKKYIRYPYGNQPPKYYRKEFNEFLDSLGYEQPMYRHMDVDLRDCSAAPTEERIGKMNVGDTILLHERPWAVETIQKIAQHIDTKKIYSK